MANDEQKGGAAICDTPEWLDFCSAVASKIGGTVIEHVLDGDHHLYWTPDGSITAEAVSIVARKGDTVEQTVGHMREAYAKQGHFLDLNRQYKEKLKGATLLHWNVLNLTWDLAWRPKSVRKADGTVEDYKPIIISREQLSDFNDVATVTKFLLDEFEATRATPEGS